MPRRSPSTGPRPTRDGATQTVPAFLESLDHPHADAVARLREIILGVDPAIGEEIKWNAPSFHVREHFATFHLRHRTGVQVVLHLGVKPRPDAESRQRVADPASLLQWRAADRATVTFADLADVEAKREAFVAVLRQWVALLA